MKFIFDGFYLGRTPLSLKNIIENSDFHDLN